MTTLWHFTCTHAREQLGKRGHLKPYPHPFLPELPAMVWLTSESTPAREDVGLTSTILTCDRLEHRYKVVEGESLPWTLVRAKVRPEMVLLLEHGRKPESWFVSFKPVKVELSR